MFFTAGYRAFLANGTGIEVARDDIKATAQNRHSLNAYNFFW